MQKNKSLNNKKLFTFYHQKKASWKWSMQRDGWMDGSVGEMRVSK